MFLSSIIWSEIGSDRIAGFSKQLSVGTNRSSAVEVYQIMERAVPQILTYNLTLVSWKQVDHKVSVEILSPKHENKHVLIIISHVLNSLLHLMQVMPVIKLTDSQAHKVSASPVGQGVTYSALTDTNQEAAWRFVHQKFLGLPVNICSRLNI